MSPTMSCCDKPPQKPASGPDKPPDEASKSIPVLIQRTTSSSEPCTDVLNMNSYSNKAVKNQSWASNYLQSIGLTYDKTILKRKSKMNPNLDNANNFLTKESTVKTVEDVNLANIIPNVNDNYVCNPANVIHENDASFANYSNIAPTAHAMPANTYATPYANDINTYYFNQPTENVQCPIIYYNSVSTPNTIVDANLSTTYSNVFDQSINDVSNNNIYYNSNVTPQFHGVNLPVTYPDTYSSQNNNYYGQISNLNNNNLWTSTSICNSYNKTTTATINKNLQSLNSVIYENPKYANSSITFNESKAFNSHNIESKTEQSTTSNAIEESKCCKCSCSKIKPDEKQSEKDENSRAKELEQAIRSKVQENERKLLDFLQKLNMDRQSEQEKNKAIIIDKSNEDTTENTYLKPTDSQQAKKTHLKVTKNKSTDKDEPISKKRKEIKILPAEKTKTKIKHVCEQEDKVKIKSKVPEFQQDEKFIKTKYVDEQEPSIIRKRKEVVFLQDEETRPKFIKTTYVDVQEPTYHPTKKARIYKDYENKMYTNPEHKTIKTARIESKYEKPKSDTKISKSKRSTSEKVLLARKGIKDSSQKEKATSTEFTKCYKYRCKVNDNTSKTSPVKSIINVAKKCKSNKLSRNKLPENGDLRDMLSRKLFKKENIVKKDRDHERTKKKCSDVTSDKKLIITVNNNIGKIEKSPEKSLDKSKSKCESRKKINLVINIVYKEPSSQSESDKSDSDDHSQQVHSDLSFLDEINVDEIVESLNKSENTDIHKNIISDDPGTIPGGINSITKTDISDDFIKKENSDTDKTEVLISNGDLLNNLILKEANLLDSLRLLHLEIETEKRCVGNYFPRKENESFNSENNEPGSIMLQSIEDQTQSLTPLCALLERTKKRETKDRIDAEVKIHPCDEQSGRSNDIKSSYVTLCNSIEDILNADEIKEQADISNVSENKIIEETNIVDEDLSVPVIDLSIDDSMDEGKPFINSEAEETVHNVTQKSRKLLKDTIDLTIDENSNKLNLLNSDVKDTDEKILFEKQSTNALVDGTILKEKEMINTSSTEENKQLLMEETIQEKINSLETERNNKQTQYIQTFTPQSRIELGSGTPKTVAEDFNIIQIIERDSTRVKIFKNVTEIQNVTPLNQKDVEPANNTSDIVNRSETSTDIIQNKEKNVRNNVNNPVNILNQTDKTINDTSKELNENKCHVKNNESSKTENENLTISDSTITKDIRYPSSSQKIQSKDHTVIEEVRDYNKMATNIKGSDVAIACRLEREMFNLLNENLSVVSLIHSGTYSKIFRCRNETIGRDYAVKSLNGCTSAFKRANQRDMMFALQNGVTRSTYPCLFIINSFQLHARLCYFMDYYPKNLKRALEENAKPFHINVVRNLATQLVSAVMLLKKHDIVHLDIKPTHVLLNHANSKLKLCGFDEARKIHNIPLHPVGTVNYRAPESIIGYELGCEMDVWGVGLVLYEMATNIQLFPGFESNDVLFKQMCTLGALPGEMIHRSRYGFKHFTGSSFKRVMGHRHNIHIITKFNRSRRLETTICKAYNFYWRPKASKQGLVEDLDKIMYFTLLLNEMLQIVPTNRMPIQFVNAHPFITGERY